MSCNSDFSARSRRSFNASSRSERFSAASSARSSALSADPADVLELPMETAHGDVLRRYQQALVTSDAPEVTTTDNLQAEPLLEKLQQRNKEVQNLKTQVDYLTTQLEALRSVQTPESSVLGKTVQQLKVELSRTNLQMIAVQNQRDFLQAEVSRLKAVLLLREKQLQIFQRPAKMPKPPKIELGEKVKILLNENKKLLYQLVENRNKLTKEQFVALVDDKLKEAVQLQTDLLNSKNEALEAKVDELSDSQAKQTAIIKTFEREAVKALESADSEFRKQLGSLKTEISVLNRQLDQKEDTIRQLQLRQRNFDTQTVVLKEIAAQKDDLIDRKRGENQDLKQEMLARNIQCRGVLRDAQQQISEKLAGMKRENAALAGQFERLQSNAGQEGAAQRRLGEVYKQLDEIRALCGLE